MMRDGKTVLSLKKILTDILLLCFGIQILWGALWAVFHIGSMQTFRETEELLDIAQTWVVDDYVGILYPLLIRLAQIVSAVLPFPWYSLLYVAQTAFLGWAVSLFCRRFSRGKRVFLTAGILAPPTVLQLCFAVLPQAVAAALLLLTVRTASDKKYKRAACFWLLAALCIPEYVWFGGIGFVLCLIGNELRHRGSRRGFLRGLAAGLVCILLVVTYRSAVVEVHGRGRMERTAAACLMHRAVWPSFEIAGFFWEDRVKEELSWPQLRAVSEYPENVYTKFGYVLEQRYGVRDMQKTYRNMALVMLKINTREIVTWTAQDGLSYLFPPAAMIWSLAGRGVSYSGWNYSRLTEKAPLIGRIYVEFGGFAFGVMLLAALLAGVLRLRRAGRAGGRAGQPTATGDGGLEIATTGGRTAAAAVCPESQSRPGVSGFGLAAVCLAQILWYTLYAAGMQDYRNVTLVCICWGVWFAATVPPCSGNGANGA